MPGIDDFNDPLTETDSKVTDLTAIPGPLPGDPRRQAVPSISGTIYQAWWSIDAWLRLKTADEVIYLEGAEDFDFVARDRATAAQVKRNTGSISLNNKKAHEALENFWTLVVKEPSRQTDFHYLTTSSIAREKDARFDGMKGIEAWSPAQTNPDLAGKLIGYLTEKLNASSPLRAFLASASPAEAQNRLFRRFHWLTDQPDIGAVKESVKDRITVLLSDQGRSLAQIENVQKYLESRFWETVSQRSLAHRALTRAELLRQVDAATTTYIPVSIETLPELIGKTRPGWDLFNLLLDKIPSPPEPLLQREKLTRTLEELVKRRKVVLLTGTVYKGKTTVAQLVATTLCPDAWWLVLSGKTPNQVDMLFRVLAAQIEEGGCPSLVVFDDLDISPSAHRIYKDSLALAIHRATATGRGIILTAQGESSGASVTHGFKNLEALTVPEMDEEEIKVLCIEHGCPTELADTWSPFVTAMTRGHPKLVQVRIADLAARNWPRPRANDVISHPSSVTSVQTMARQLLSESVTSPIAEYVYLTSVCTVPLHRSIAIHLAETVEGVKNGGDVIDNLAGKWLERIGGDHFRTTELLKGVASDVWSQDKLKEAHIRVHDAIRSKRSLDTSEGAALLFHAYLGGEPRRIAHTAAVLRVIESEDAKLEVERQLQWLPFFALDAGQSITDDVWAAATLRGLQYDVAKTLDSDSLPAICQRWADDIERVTHAEAKAAFKAMLWYSIGFSENPKIPLGLRLEAMIGIPTLPSGIAEIDRDPGQKFFKIANGLGGLPTSGTTNQAIFYCAIQAVRDLDSLSELLNWLNDVATDTVRQEFDEMLEWPPVQTSGAFVNSAWTAVHEEVDDWKPWIALFDRINGYAKEHSSPRFGREAAKAKAIILTEYLDRGEDALTELDQAEAAFGKSPILLEQRANVRFHAQNDESVLEIWGQLTSDPANREFLDPFACRRAGISAARLKRWDEAGRTFLEAASLAESGNLELTTFGLRVDAALSYSLDGNQTIAAKVLTEAVLELPSEAADEGDERWEAVQRAAVSVCRTIERRLRKSKEAEPQFEPGYASAPDLKTSEVEPGQAARYEMTRAQVLHLASTLGIDQPRLENELKILVKSKYFPVRHLSREAQLALSYRAGSGAGFVEALLEFDVATVDFLNKMQNKEGYLDPDDGPALTQQAAPERWFGLLCAGVACTGDNLLANMYIWLNESRQLLGKEATLTKNIQALIQGASLPVDKLKDAVNNAESPSLFRCGAVAKLLLSTRSAEETLQLQALLTSGVVSDVSRSRQQLFNLHIARCFSEAWRAHSQNQFQFYSPRISVPALLDALDLLECGNGTLRGVLNSASKALRYPLGDYMELVL